VNAEGLKAKFFMIILFWPAVLVCGGGEELTFEVFDVHPAIAVTVANSTTTIRTASFFLRSCFHLSSVKLLGSRIEFNNPKNVPFGVLTHDYISDARNSCFWP